MAPNERPRSPSEPPMAPNPRHAQASPRAFVLRHTRLRPVPGGRGLRLHLADDVLAVWGGAQARAGLDAPLPYWAFAWAGGLALTRYLAEHPEVVAGRKVCDLASGSGLCALAALRAGAERVRAVDIDSLAAAAIELNARAAGARLTVTIGDPLDGDPPDDEVILAGDVCYEADLAGRAMTWLRRAAEGGATVLIGDPGRRYLPATGLVEVARYEVRTTTELEDLERKDAAVYTLWPPERAPTGRELHVRAPAGS